MFNNKPKKGQPTEKRAVNSRNVIGSGTQINGDVISEGDFRIDGTLEGTLKTKGRVIIGKEGFINGKVECANADVEGKFSGEFIVNNILTAKSTAKIVGDVTVGQISTEPGASFNATCNMKGSIKELTQTENEQKTTEATA